MYNHINTLNIYLKSIECFFQHIIKFHACVQCIETSLEGVFIDRISIIAIL